ncbi:MAG: hypothetical protein AAF662_01820 [Pseudomonadota bacterium]
MKQISIAALMMTLPLLWVSLLPAGSEGSIKPFHVAALALIGITVSTRSGWTGILSVHRSTKPFTYSVMMYLLFIALPLVVFKEPYFSSGAVAKEVFAIATGFSISAVTYGFIVRNAPPSRVISIVGLLTLIMTLGVLSYSLYATGRNPLDTIRLAFSRGDPDIIIFNLFRASLAEAAQSEEVRSNLRHGIVSGLYVSVLFSSIAFSMNQPARFIGRALHGLTWILLTAVILLSFSRSLGLTLLITLGAALVIQAKRSTSDLQRFAIFAGALCIVAGLFASIMGDLIVERLVNDTGSYTGRTQAMSLAFDAILASPVVPLERNALLPSPHNAILRAWLGAGFLAAVAMAIALVYLLRAWIGVFFCGLRADRWVVSISPTIVLAAGALPLIRFFTAGSGVNTVQEWTALGIFLGSWAALKSRSHQSVVQKTNKQRRTHSRAVADASLSGQTSNPTSL